MVCSVIPGTNYRKIIKPLVLASYFLLFSSLLFSQKIGTVVVNTGPGLNVTNLLLSDSSEISLQGTRPLFTFTVDEKIFNSEETEALKSDSGYIQIFGGKVKVTTKTSAEVYTGWKSELIFQNTGSDTITLSNVLPFSTNRASSWITGSGPWDLARAWLYLPGYRPVRVILPDNAWELGYVSFNAGNLSLCALARRQQTVGGQKKRYETSLPPGAQVYYSIYADLFTGEWQNGLKLMFRDRYIYDLEKFDNTLFKRDDLKWIRGSYIIVLGMAWDREFYDRSTGKYTYSDQLKRWNEEFGFIDVFGIWPTWPRLGLDQRNQWDMYRDLPGGTNQLRNFARLSRQNNTKFFISYNPWDNSTRKEDHYSGMAQLIAETEADGVVLDTRGNSSYELQAAADSVRKGVVMFSEGMAIPKDMPGIIAGRVHNAIYLSPELNLNKLIKPDFSIFRVCDVGEDRNHREIAIAFFNGYGTELNMFRPGGRNDGYRNDLDLLARTTFILRQNNDAFLDNDWTPFLPTTTDNAWVNRWRSGDKTLYTILNMKPDGLRTGLFRIEKEQGRHYVSLWQHKTIVPKAVNDSLFLNAEAEGWDPALAGTRLEGSVDCIASFPELINAEIRGDSLRISVRGNGQLLLWKGDPSFKTQRFELKFKGDTTIRLKNIISYYEGKLVLQYLENNRLKDESIVTVKGGAPWLISSVSRTKREKSVPTDMVLVPKTSITYTLTTREDFIPYPDINKPVTAGIDSFLIDKYPVTNAQFLEFLNSSGFKPADTTGFLRHWENGTIKQGQERYPVVYVAFEDMAAYAKWCGKRLPTEAEWQLAAQGTDGRAWPWGNEFHGTWCNNSFERATPVDAFAKGASPYGVFDMVGNVWQVTNDMYFNGTNYFIVIRGGSYYRPDSSWWYIQGGPQQLDRTQIMLMVSPGFDRTATVGFRCAKDVVPGSIATKDKRQK